MKLKELDNILSKIPEEKKDAAMLIYNELSFILITIEELKKQIQENGAVEHFINGKQDFLRESPAMASYNKLMKTFDIFYKNLINLVPKEDINIIDDFDDDDLT